MGVDELAMRQTMGRFATGVAVVTTMHDEEPHGMTINSLTSVSLDPPMLLICMGANARTADAVMAAGRFAVSVLSARQEPIARRFAVRGDDHFAGLPLNFGEHVVPVVPDAVAHLECEVDHGEVAGDHLVVYGRVLRTCCREGGALTFHGGHFGDFVARGERPDLWFF